MTDMDSLLGELFAAASSGEAPPPLDNPPRSIVQDALLTHAALVRELGVLEEARPVFTPLTTGPGMESNQ